MISEDFGIDVDSVMLHWWVTVTETDEQLAAGESPMQVNQTNQMGQRMQFDGVLDLNEVDEIWMQRNCFAIFILQAETWQEIALRSLQIIVEPTIPFVADAPCATRICSHAKCCELCQN